MKLILQWIAISLAVYITAYLNLIKGIAVANIQTIFIIGACLVLINMFIKPVIKILTLPINIVTLGFFSLIINGLIFWYLGSGIINGFTVTGFNAAFWGSIVVSVLNWVLMKLLKL
ncbi:MAG: phage holin family protein [Patescibacteria group bacterium]|nr:phage holin family protein [Patescibacteria group bacterium]